MYPTVQSALGFLLQLSILHDDKNFFSRVNVKAKKDYR
jgi:hypothetical protein